MSGGLGTDPGGDPFLAGRVALVTGGSRGIGRAIALELARSGAALAVNYRRDEAAAAAVVAEIEAIGGTAIAVQASVDRGEDADALADAVLERFGAVDIFVSNAGVASGGLLVADTEPEEFERLMATHAFSAQRLARRLLPGMRAAPRGDVVIVSSSEVAEMRARGGPYNMAKAAAEALAMTLAKEEIANGVHVNVVAPGLVATEMGTRLVRGKLGVDDISELDADQPLGRVCRPEDVARVVRFLVSPDAGYLAGQRIGVDGGVNASPTG